MAQEIEIKQSKEALSVVKENGTEVHYFLYPEFEVHTNKIPAGSIQDWHRHRQIEEVIVVTSGKISVETIENEKIETREVNQGDVLRVKNSIHRLVNRNRESASFIVFRFVPQGIDQADIIKNDKCDCEELIKTVLKN
ncbi:cupin domain-containing protein [Streptococcus sp. ZY19097]|uniref:cupin domain-containing protein n=1 Tax=Streptococcus sp. ZY19097 TaxID=3231906 RepID=UPI003458F299